MPLKVAVLELGEVDQLARLAGAGNTLVLDGGERWVYNTDVGGLIWAVGQVAAAPLHEGHHPGRGGHGRAALIAASQLGAQQVTVVARTPARAEALRALSLELGVELEIRPWWTRLPDADLVVSTVVSGAADGIRPGCGVQRPTDRRHHLRSLADCPRNGRSSEPAAPS